MINLKEMKNHKSADQEVVPEEILIAQAIDTDRIEEGQEVTTEIMDGEDQEVVSDEGQKVVSDDDQKVMNVEDQKVVREEDQEVEGEKINIEADLEKGIIKAVVNL